MHCCIKSCNISDDRFLWKCEFCSKVYHAACVGVQRHQEMYITSYMIPLCADCQHHLKTGIDTRKVLCQQEQLFSAIKTQTDANLRIAADIKKLNAMGELFDHMELQLKESVSTINHNTATKVANAVSTLSRDIEGSLANNGSELVDVKNHLTTLFNISMEATRNRIEAYVNDLTIDLTSELKNICSSVQNLSSLSIDMAAHCNEHNTDQSNSTHEALNVVKTLANTVSGDVLIEVKSLRSAITNLDDNIKNSRLPVSPPSLMEELRDRSINSADQSSRSNQNTTEGWRTLGSRKVWRADWTEYDTRKMRRAQQQRARDKAMKKRKAHKNNNNSNDEVATGSYYNYNNINRSNTNKHQNDPSRSYQNNNSSNNIHNNHQPVTSSLLPDKDLLAAAKATFSKPPVERQRGIRFQRGEILNPYPVDHQPPQTNSISTPDCPDLVGVPAPVPVHSFNMSGSNLAAPCQACACRHSCFARN